MQAIAESDMVKKRSARLYSSDALVGVTDVKGSARSQVSPYRF